MQYAEYIDWLTRIKLAAYGLSGIDANIFADVNRATGEVQERASKSKGLRSYKKLIEEYMTRQVIRELGDEFKYLEFHFVESEELTERKTNADIDKIYIDGGVVTSNEIRKMRYGLEPLPEPTFDEELDAKVRDAM